MQRYTPEREKRCRPHLKACNDSWKVDETSIKIKKVWFYLSRAVDSEGATIEFLLSPMRDAEAAKRFFLNALRPTTDSAPQAHPIEEQMSQPTEARFAPVIADQVRTKRRGQAGTCWYVDETSLKVHGKWWYLYRAIDQDGNLVDSMFRFSLPMESAQRFFKQAVAVVGHVPDQVTTDEHRSYPRAIRETMGSNVHHRTSKYLNNRLEQDHRGIKQRSYPIRGCGNR